MKSIVIHETVMLNGYNLLNVLTHIADNATDELLADADRQTYRCGTKRCKICPANRRLLKVLRELRVIRQEKEPQ